MKGCLRQAEAWRLRRRTLHAMVLLCRARLLVALVPLARWRGSLGLDGEGAGGRESGREARRLALHVERAAARLPFETKCLARAMALSWLLRARAIPHALVIAARPRAARGGDDALHAWVEQGGAIVLGELPGPWLEMLRAGAGDPMDSAVGN